MHASDVELIAAVRGTLLDCWRQDVPAAEWAARTLHVSAGGVYGAAATSICETLLSRLICSGGSPSTKLLAYIDEAISSLVPFTTWFEMMQSRSQKNGLRDFRTLSCILNLVDSYKGALFGDNTDNAASTQDHIQIDTHASTVHAEAQQLHQLIVFTSESVIAVFEHHMSDRGAARVVEQGLVMLADLLDRPGTMLRLLLSACDRSLLDTSLWPSLHSTLLRLVQHVHASDLLFHVCSQRVCKAWSRLLQCKHNERVSAYDTGVDANPLYLLSPHDRINTQVSFALFARLLEFMSTASCSEYSERLGHLRLLYGLTNHQLYVDILASHLRICHQTKDTALQMQNSSILLVLLPQVIRELENNNASRTMLQEHQPNDVELALCQLINFSTLCLTEFAEGVTWFDVLVDALSLQGLCRMPMLHQMLPETVLCTSLFESFALALPPPVAHGDAVMCSDLNELSTLVHELCSADGSGSSLSAEFVLHLVDLSLARQTWCHRVQKIVVTKLIPRLLQADFELPLVVLDALLKRLGRQACIFVLLMHGVLEQVVHSLLQLWRVEADKSGADNLRLRIDVLSRCHYLLLQVFAEYPHLKDTESSAIAAEFFELASGRSRKSLHPDRHKTIAQRIVNVSAQTSPQTFTWADGLRKACVNVVAEDVLLTVRFVILPNMYSKIAEQEKYRGFLAVLIEGMPYVGGAAVEYVCTTISEDIEAKKNVRKHLPIVECLLDVADKLDLPLMAEFFRRRLCRSLCVNRDPETSKAVASIFGSGYMSSLSKHSDRSELLTKHAEYLLRSHTSYMCTSWKDMSSVHRPVLLTCEHQLGQLTFVSTLLKLLPPPVTTLSSKTPADTKSAVQLVDAIRNAEIVAALIATSPTLLKCLCVNVLPTAASALSSKSAFEAHAGLATLVMLSFVLSNADDKHSCADSVFEVVVGQLEREVSSLEGTRRAAWPPMTPSFAVCFLSMCSSLPRPNTLSSRLPLDRISPLLDRLALDALAVACHPINAFEECKDMLARIPTSTH